MYFNPELYIIASVLSLIAAIILAILFLPLKRRASLTGFGAWLHDLFNFRTLVIEKIFKFLYILATCFCIFLGLAMMIGAAGAKYGAGGMILSGFLVLLLGPVAVRITYELFMMFILLVTNVMEINKKIGHLPAGDKSAPQAGYQPAPAPTAYAPQAPAQQAPVYRPQAPAQQASVYRPQAPAQQAPVYHPQAPAQQAPAAPAQEAPAAPAEEAPAAPAEPKYVFCTQCGTKYDANQGNCPNCGKQ